MYDTIREARISYFTRDVRVKGERRVSAYQHLGVRGERLVLLHLVCVKKKKRRLSCREIVETHVCKLRVIFRSRVLRVIHDLVKDIGRWLPSDVYHIYIPRTRCSFGMCGT